MPTTVFTATHSLALVDGADSGTELSWTSTTAISDPHTVVDQGDDGNLNEGVDTAGSDATYTGYFVDIGGETFGVFYSATFNVFFIPFNDTVNDISTQLTGAGSTNTKNSNAFTLANCFLSGTRIKTPDGEPAIEDLSIGDPVCTADGRVVPVKWVGRQIVQAPAANLSTDQALAPVCIAAGTLGNHSDLYVSADHGMILDGYVINAAALVNHDTIRFVPASEMPREYTYCHIETEAHDVILANGAPAETFMDAAGRSAFDNHAEYLALYGAERIIPEMDRPRISSARLLPASIRARLGMTDAPDLAQLG